MSDVTDGQMRAVISNDALQRNGADTSASKQAFCIAVVVWKRQKGSRSPAEPAAESICQKPISRRNNGYVIRHTISSASEAGPYVHKIFQSVSGVDGSINGVIF